MLPGNSELVRRMRKLMARIRVNLASVQTRLRTSDADAESRAKDELVAMLAHELRNPLAPISVTLETIAMTGRAAPEQIAMMQRQCAQLNRLINDLLDVSRLRQGRLAIQCVPIDLAAVATRGLDLVTRLIEPPRHDIELQLGRGACVLGDGERLAQVVAALVSNAVRFSAVGDPVVVAVDRHGERARIQVRDRGEGMTADRLARLFDPFEQDRQPLARSKGGLGLGLALSRGIIELHGGTLSARSAGLGHGSVFTVEIPLHH
jgi:signal transduction histidine kinase